LSEEQTTKKWRWGVNRWIVLLLIILGIFGARAYAPIQPHVQLPAEELTGRISLGFLGEIALTNTMVAMFLVDIIVVVIALAVRSAVKRAEKEGYTMARGLSGAIEALFEYLYNMTETTAGKWAKSIFPYFAAITLVVLVANWMELIPGVDSIGLLHHAEHGYETQQLLPGVTAIVKEEAEHGGYNVIPFVRVLSTDLNFTVALALVSVFMTQVIGVRAQGMKYFTKFWNTKGFFSKPIFGLIDWAVGLLEIVSEISKILSFSFRLFGNIFAGSVMLFVIGSLVPIVAQAGFLGLEFFVGLIQAIVFGLLTMIFMAMATQGHGEEEH
jgi:F-type H+-transporting ATPase subunit a